MMEMILAVKPIDENVYFLPSWNFQFLAYFDDIGSLRMCLFASKILP